MLVRIVSEPVKSKCFVKSGLLATRHFLQLDKS